MSTIHPTWDHEPKTHRDTSIERERRPSTPYPPRSRSRSPPGGPCQGELECEGRYDCACNSRQIHGQRDGYGDDDEDSLFDDDHEGRLILPPSTSCLESDTDTDSASVYSGTGDEEGYPSDVADVDDEEEEGGDDAEDEREAEGGSDKNAIIGNDVIFKQVEVNEDLSIVKGDSHANRGWILVTISNPAESSHSHSHSQSNSTHNHIHKCPPAPPPTPAAGPTSTSTGSTNNTQLNLNIDARLAWLSLYTPSLLLTPSPTQTPSPTPKGEWVSTPRPAVTRSQSWTASSSPSTTPKAGFARDVIQPAQPSVPSPGTITIPTIPPPPPVPFLRPPPPVYMHHPPPPPVHLNKGSSIYRPAHELEMHFLGLDRAGGKGEDTESTDGTAGGEAPPT